MQTWCEVLPLHGCVDGTCASCFIQFGAVPYEMNKAERQAHWHDLKEDVFIEMAEDLHLFWILVCLET